MHALVKGLGYAPRTCTWELTLRCNLRCGHCGSSAGRPRPDEMPRQTALRVAGELAGLGCRRLSLSGGEPTMSPWWRDVAAEGTRLGMNVNMITNGMSGGKDLVRSARDSGLVSLGVSLDGLEAEHDRNRRMPGLYGRVMSLVDECNVEGLPVGAITTITKDNFRDLGALHDQLAGRVYVWQLQVGASMGNLAGRPGRQIEPKDLLDVVPTVADLIRENRVSIHVADNLGYFGPYEKVLRTRRTSPAGCWVGCYAGCRHLGIEADGGIKGCLSIQATRAVEGNLQLEALRDIWLRPGAFAYNRDFAFDDLAGFCRTCEHAGICRGGCLSMRVCEGGRDNPFCYHRVATLADRARRGRRRYVPMFVAPAALLAAFGLGGCGSVASPQDDADVDVDAVDYYGMPDDADIPTGADAYGIDAPDQDADLPGDLYGLPGDADVDAEFDADVDAVDYYGMPEPDADPPGADAYGLPEPDADADADVDAASWYGMPDPDAGADADAEANADGDVDAATFYGMPEPDPGS